MSVDAYYTLAFATLVYIGLWAIGRWVLPRFHILDGTLEGQKAELQRQIGDLAARLADSERRLADSERKNVDLEKTQDFLLRQLETANAKMGRQDERIVELSGKINELERSVSQPHAEANPASTLKIGRVLGVWPEPVKLDSIGEKDAIYSTGLEYESLEGAAATRMGIVEQLGQRSDYRIMEIGAKGGQSGIQLHDGITPPLWWSDLAKQHNIDIFVVLSNESSKPGVTNVADALYNAGAKAVISVDSSISDLDAVKFARFLYRKLSRGASLKASVNAARLVISDAGAETIKLRERS